MCLQRKPPGRVSKTVTRRSLEIFAVVRVVHGLQEEVLKIQSFELWRVRPDLREDELQLVALALCERNACLGADANPIDAARSGARSIGLQRHHETASVKRFDEGGVKLQRRLAACTDDIGLARASFDNRVPDVIDCVGESFGAFELASAGSVIAHEIGVAKAAERFALVAYLPGPEIASGEAQEDGRPPHLRALTLQCREDFFDSVHGSKLAPQRRNATRDSPFREDCRRDMRRTRTPTRGGARGRPCSKYACIRRRYPLDFGRPARALAPRFRPSYAT